MNYEALSIPKFKIRNPEFQITSAIHFQVQVLFLLVV
jgi:hypothetical protein